MKVFQLFLFGIVLISGCDNSTSSNPPGVFATVSGNELKIINTTESEVYYVVFESSSEALNDWLPFCRETNKIISGSTTSIEFTDSTYLPSNQAHIYWWHKGNKYPSWDLYGADSLRNMFVQIK